MPPKVGTELVRQLDLTQLQTPAPLPTNVLPTIGDIIRYSLELRAQTHYKTKKKLTRSIPYADLAAIITNDVYNIWQSAAKQFVYPVIMKKNSVLTKASYTILCFGQHLY